MNSSLDQISNLHDFLIWASSVAILITIMGMIFFGVKYKKKNSPRQDHENNYNAALEFLWSYIPLMIFIGLFAWGWKYYHQNRSDDAGAIEIQISSKKWQWDLKYQNGLDVTNKMVVPVNHAILVRLTSTDVVHSFYVPTLRIKQDALPGKLTSFWFNADRVGEYQVFCTEFCGTSHGQMLMKIQVVTLEDFHKFLSARN